MAIRSRIGGSEFKIERVNSEKGECDARRILDGKLFRDAPIGQFQADCVEEYMRAFHIESLNEVDTPPEPTAEEDGSAKVCKVCGIVVPSDSDCGCDA